MKTRKNKTNYKLIADYLKDSNPTPLGALTDFMAEDRKSLKELSRYRA